jgi:hypothetical protein
MHTALVLKLMKDRSLWELTDGEPSCGTNVEPRKTMEVGQAVGV